MLVQVFPAILGSGFGILSPNRTKLFQHALHHVIQTMLLYKRGPPVDDLQRHVRSAYTAFVLLARLLGRPELWPKLHELLHVPRDVLWFGAANSTDAGVHACVRVHLQACECAGVFVFACARQCVCAPVHASVFLCVAYVCRCCDSF